MAADATTLTSRRARVEGHVRSRVKRIKEKVDDPMLAWFCLFVSAVVLVTRLYLNQPDSVLTIGIPASQGGQGQGQGQGGEGAKLPGGCEPLDEVCAARMLAESEGVSHFEDVTTHNFYNLMSQYATYLITFLTLYLFSFAGLRRYQRRRDGYKLRRSLGEEQVTELQQLLMDEPASENEDFIPFVLCAFSVSVSVAALLLVPITILYGFWVKCTHGEDQPPDQGVVSSDFGDVWAMLFPLSNLCHFVVIPSAFFYSESEGIGLWWRPSHPTSKVFSRLIETGVTVSLVLALLSLPLMVFQSLRAVQLERLAFSYVMTSSCGASIFLVFAPFGFDRLIRRSLAALESHGAGRQAGEGGLAGKAEVIECELNAKLERMRRISHGDEDAIADAEVVKLRGEIEELEREAATSIHSGVAPSSILRGVQLWTAIIVTLLLPTTVLVRVVIWQSLGVTSRLPLSLFISPTTDPETRRYSSSQLAAEACHVAFDMGLLYYLWIATWHGVRNFPYLSMWYQKQRARGLTERVLSLHCLLFLCINTSYPLITCTMGLTQLDHIRDNSATEYFQRPGVILGFNAIFMLACSCALAHAMLSNSSHGGGGAGLWRAVRKKTRTE